MKTQTKNKKRVLDAYSFMLTCNKCGQITEGVVSFTIRGKKYLDSIRKARGMKA